MSILIYIDLIEGSRVRKPISYWPPPLVDQFPLICPLNLYINLNLQARPQNPKKAGLCAIFEMVWRALCTLSFCSDKCWSSRQGGEEEQTMNRSCSEADGSLAKSVWDVTEPQSPRASEPHSPRAISEWKRLKIGCVVKSSRDVTAG